MSLDAFDYTPLERVALFTRNLRRYRRASGYTQRQLADRAGVSVQAIRLWEHGTRVPLLTNVFQLANALEIDAWVLCSDMGKASG